ncbi:Atu2307/SP_0267 family LLM class monooxygenase [Novosphingobium kaempferiae]|uniref:Atu2307/SP_0267 family LLM class monooxygenase n=1 Tax=Novosphingobium kaempferiae TaxID=2896849 RepID=UPI001E358978|nr:Atu2307/SP_0267 family LLM class monooxygenase [Novosphingobium kaempferiae]
MEIGIDSFAVNLPAADGAGVTAAQRMAQLLEEIEIADRAGIDVFGIGEHHKDYTLDSAPAVILAAAAARTSRIRLTSAVTVLSADDPVRVFQDFATLDLISNGRAEMVVGRGSSLEAYPLFGHAMPDYDALFTEKLDLLLKVREHTHVTWNGRFRPALTGQGIYPRPAQEVLPVWLGVGGTPHSFARAGALGLPLMIAIIGGGFERFRPLVDLYKEAGRHAGHAPEQLKVGVHAIGFVAQTDQEARDLFFPGWARMFGIAARERGWAPPTRAQFDAACSPSGAYLVGSPETATLRARAASEALGGVSRITFQMSSGENDQAAMRRSIELLGQEVAPAIRRAGAKGTS